MNTLAEFILLPMLEKRTSRSFLGKSKIRFGDLLQVSGLAYESAAIASRALSDKSSFLEALIGKPDAPSSPLNLLKDLARKRREAFPAQTSIPVLVMESELNKMGLSMQNMESIEETTRALDAEKPVDQVKPIGEMLCLEGFGFGLEYPDLTREFYRRTYEEIDEENWELIHGMGVAIPQRPTVYPFEEREEDVLKLVAYFAQEMKPEVITSFGISNFIESVISGNMNPERSHLTEECEDLARGKNQCPKCEYMNPVSNVFCAGCGLHVATTSGDDTIEPACPNPTENTLQETVQSPTIPEIVPLCKKCDHESPIGAKHCISCGERFLNLICTKCETENIPEAKFCMECGEQRY